MVAMLSCIAMTVYAEDAPVYDVDNYPPQFDGQADSGSTNNQPSSQPSQPQSPALSQQGSPASHQDAQPVEPPQPSLSPDQRLARIEQQVTNMQHANSTAKLNDLQSEIQTLRGQVEDLTHQLQQMQSQQRSMYSDLDKRINKQVMVTQAATTDQQASSDEDKPILRKKIVKSKSQLVTAKQKPMPVADDEAATATPADTQTGSATPVKTISKVASDPQPSANSEQEELQMYQNAYDLIKDSKFDQAIAVLKTMLKKYPTGQSAANAHYWLGELYGLQKKKDQSASEFSAVVKNYPDSPKVSDAQVKLGMIYAAEFNWPEAKATFKKVMSRYPGTTSARLASEQLKEIRSAGH